MKTFKEWLSKKLDEMGGAMAGGGPFIVGSHKRTRDFNIWGAPGASGGVSPKEGPIMKSNKKKTS